RRCSPCSRTAARARRCRCARPSSAPRNDVSTSASAVRANSPSASRADDNHFMTRLIRRPAVAVVAATISTVLYAAPPSFWTVSTQADFLKGTVDGLSVDAAGRLRLGPDVERLADPDAPFVWSLAPFGDAWLAGTGNDGKVLRF